MNKNMATSRAVTRVILYLIVVILSLVFLIPMISVIMNSFKSDTQIQMDMTSVRAFLPNGKLTLDNYSKIFVRMDFFKFFWNSTVSSVVSVIGSTIFSAMAGYAVGMLEFKGRNFLQTIMIGMIIVPGEAVCINQMMVINQMGLINNMWALILPFLASPLFVFLYIQHFKGLPKDLMQAAVIDGSSYFGIFWKIMLPLSHPVTATVAILGFIWRWNDLIWPVLVTRDESIRTLPLAMQMLYTQNYTYWGQIFAFAVMMTLPVLIIFIIFQKQFVQSLAMTGIKG